MPRKHSDGKLDMKILRATAEKCSNWGRWGPDDEIGTLNHVAPEDIVKAAQLIRKGQVFSLALNFDNQGPQSGLLGQPFQPDPHHARNRHPTRSPAGRTRAVCDTPTTWCRCPCNAAPNGMRSAISSI